MYVSTPLLLPRQEKLPHTRMPPPMLSRTQIHPIALLPPLQRPLRAQPRVRVTVFRPALAADARLQHSGGDELQVGHEARADAAVRVIAVDLVLGDLLEAVEEEVDVAIVGIVAAF